MLVAIVDRSVTVAVLPNHGGYRKTARPGRRAKSLPQRGAIGEDAPKGVSRIRSRSEMREGISPPGDHERLPPVSSVEILGKVCLSVEGADDFFHATSLTNQFGLVNYA